MVGGLGDPFEFYLSELKMTLEAVANPTDATGTELDSTSFIMPGYLVWRQISLKHTGDGTSTGKYLRLKFSYGPESVTGSAVGGGGYGAIGKASITTTEPDTWPRENLLVNGDFEDYSSLPAGTNNNDGYIDLFSYYEHYTQGSVPGWDTTGVWYGLQCMLWVPPPQPAMGRVSAWFDGTIEQYVPTAMVNGQEYHVDFMACINGSAYVSGLDWPATNPNMVVEVYWLGAGETDLTGTHGLITSASIQTPIEGPVLGNPAYTGNPYTPWLSEEASFTADAALAGKELYVKAYCDNPTVVYPTFEEIYLSTEPRTQVGPYTCYEQNNTYGIAAETDLDGNCVVDIDDLALFVENWMGCNDPAGCN
jgi:hypothetical protein